MKSKRRKIVAGNWKMNTTFLEAVELAKSLNTNLEAEKPNCEVIICPPYLYISELKNNVKSSLIKVGAQNCSEHLKGAFTGEVSAPMLKSVGASYVIVGHSERRQMFAENDLEIAQKAIMALENGMQVIFCCGETLEEREEGNAENVVESQVVGSLSLLIDLDPKKIIIAYEPVWAIGTGKTASPAQAVEMHQSIRKTITKYFTKEFAQSVSILYGGSVKGSNAAELFANEDIDGALVGGASLDANDFCAIIKAFS